MSINLFRAIEGVAVVADNLSTESHILHGNGAPVGNSGRTLAAPIGSVYMQTDADTDLLNFWYKHTNAGAASDWTQTASKDYVDALVSGVSWREPVKVLDQTTYANIAAAEGAANVGDTVDGITILAGDRLLFTNLTSGNENVYIVTGSSGAWTFTEDANTATDGDAVLVNEGTHADQQWIYDGIQWIQFGSAGSAADITNIENFIGKPTGSGAVFPQYDSNDIVVDNDPLNTGISKLDDALGTLQYSSNNVVTDFVSAHPASTFDVTRAISDLDTTYGDGLITNIAVNYPLTDEMVWNASGTLTITDALNLLNNAIGDRVYTEDNIITDGQTIGASLDAIDIEMGDLNTAGSWTSGGFLTQATLATNDIQENIDAFNQEIGSLNESSVENTGGPLTISTNNVLDTITAAEGNEVKWLLQIRNTATGGRRAWEIHGLSNGTIADHNRFSGLLLGAGTGLNVTIDVIISGVDMQLVVDPGTTATIVYTVKRLGVSLLA